MAAQAPLGPARPAPNTPSNGAAKFTPRPVVKKVGEFAHDLVILAELQMQLLVVDLRECVKRMVTPVLVGLVGVAMGLGVFPVALAALAFVLVETLQLTIAAALGCSVLAGIVIAGALCIFSLRQLRQQTKVLERSQSEFVRNVRWIKQVLQHNDMAETRFTQTH